MSNIILAELLSVISKYDVVRIYMERKNKSEVYKYITTSNPLDILEGSEFIFLIDSNIRVNNVEIFPDPEYGEVIDITVKEVNLNESK